MYIEIYICIYECGMPVLKYRDIIDDTESQDCASKCLILKFTAVAISLIIKLKSWPK